MEFPNEDTEQKSPKGGLLGWSRSVYRPSRKHWSGDRAPSYYTAFAFSPLHCPMMLLHKQNTQRFLWQWHHYINLSPCAYISQDTNSILSIHPRMLLQCAGFFHIHIFLFSASSFAPCTTALFNRALKLFVSNHWTLYPKTNAIKAFEGC